MAIDLYGDQPVQVGQEAVQQSFQKGQGLASSLFSRQGAMGAYQQKAGMNKQKIGEAIEAWGSDLVAQFATVGDQMMSAVKEDLEQMRYEANKARQENDMKRYQMFLDKSLFDKQMLAYGKMLKQAKVGNIMTGIIAGLGQLGAGIGESVSRKRDWQQFLADLDEIYRQTEVISGKIQTPRWTY